MNRKLQIIGVLGAAVCLLTIGGPQSATAGEPSAKDVIAKIEHSYDKLKDMRGELRVAYADEDELRKIGEDFARSFGFKKIVVGFKPPDRMRYETAHVSFAKVVVVSNGFHKAVKIPALHISKRINVKKDELGKKQYPIDFGVACGDLWTDWKVELKGTETVDGASCYVMKLTNPAGGPGEGYMEVWIDRSVWVPRRMEKRRANGQLKSRLLFKQYKLVNHLILMPYRIEVYNIDGKLGGALEYTKIDMNIGLPDSDFSVR